MWGFPIWGPDFEATSGCSLNFYKDGLLWMGLPTDKVYHLWQKKLDEVEPIQYQMELSLQGEVGGALVSRETEQVVLIKAGTFAKGEAWQLALISEDKTIMAFVKEMPDPIESRQGDYRIWVELASPDGDRFIIWGEGFEPDKELDTTSTSDGELMKSKTKVGKDGRFMIIHFPAVVGKEDGLATFSVVGKAGEVTVSYEWGLPARY